jgi:hypothetical protein
MSLLLWKNYSLEYFGVWLGLKYSKSFKKKREKFFRMLGQMAIVLSLILITISADQNAFAYTPSSQHEYLDFQPYTGNRLIDIAANAVKTWHDRIVEVTNNPFVWDMTLHIDPKNESICDGFVNYVDTPDPTIFQLSGVAGFSHPLTPVANVTIYTDDYQSTLLDMAKNDKNFWKTLTLEKFEDIIKNENHKQLDYDVINRITSREI